MDDDQQDSRRRTLDDEMSRARDLGLHLHVGTVLDTTRDALDVTDDMDDLPPGAVLPTASGTVDPGPELFSDPAVVREIVGLLRDDRERSADDVHEQIATLVALEPLLDPDEVSEIRTHLLERHAGADPSAPEKSSGDEPRCGRTRS
ncbi:hypothetical protein [Cellulosimicrobium sp. NPDC057127]|uniref:hypothetical protein n=1 Tax=Cellulosimicrobium sp. NPDC057127 TaxID=3346026 RepID=UPI0036308A84